ATQRDEIAGGVAREAGAVEQAMALAVLEVEPLDAGLRAVATPRREEHRLAAGQPLRPAVRRLACAGVEPRRRARLAANRGDAPEAPFRVGRVENVAVLAPAGAEGIGRARERDGLAAACRHLRHPPLREEAD